MFVVVVVVIRTLGNKKIDFVNSPNCDLNLDGQLWEGTPAGNIISKNKCVHRKSKVENVICNVKILNNVSSISFPFFTYS